jgi:hypothetical protein
MQRYQSNDCSTAAWWLCMWYPNEFGLRVYDGVLAFVTSQSNRHYPSCLRKRDYHSVLSLLSIC